MGGRAMTLLEAFRTLGPLIGVAEEDERRNEAARIVLAELHRLAARTTFNADVRDEIPSRVMVRMLQRLAGATRENDPDTDAGVTAWLWTCVRHTGIDLTRRKRPEKPIDTAGDPPGDSPDPLEELVGQAEVEERTAALHQLREDIVAEVAAGMQPRARDAFLEAIDDLFALAEGGVSFDDVVRARRGEVTRQAIDAVYKQHSRARQALQRAIDRLADEGRLAPDRRRHLVAIVRRLHRRASSR